MWRILNEIHLNLSAQYLSLKVVCSKQSPFLKKKEAKSREVKIIERLPTPFTFWYLIQKIVIETLSQFGKQKWVFFPGHPILSPLLPPPSAPEYNMVNKCLKFVPKHTCFSVCLQKTDTSLVMGVCLSVQIRSKVEKVLVRGSQRQNHPVVTDHALQTGPQALMGF